MLNTAMQRWKKQGFALLVLLIPTLFGILTTKSPLTDRPLSDPYQTLTRPKFAHHRLKIPSSPPPLHYQIKAQLDPDRKELKGHLNLRLKNVSDKALSELRFHLYLNAFKNDDSLFMRSSRGSHRGNRFKDQGSITIIRAHSEGRALSFSTLFDETVLKVKLNTPLASDQSRSFTLTFKAKLPRIFARTGYVDDFFMIAQWYPKLGKLYSDGRFHCPPFHSHEEFFADFARFDVEITLPSRFIVGYSGQHVSSPKKDGMRTYSLSANWIHDFVIAAWPNFVEEKFTHQGIRIRLLRPPYQAGSKHKHKLLAFGLDRLGEIFGRYPYSDLTLIEVPHFASGAAAMEYPQLFTFSYPPWAKLPLYYFDEVLLHELSHQYVQGLLATNEVDEPWLDESLATYLSGALLDERYGRACSFLKLGPLCLSQRQKNQLHLLSAKDEAFGKTAADFSSFHRYAANVYGKGANFFYRLQDLLGKEKLLSALYQYAQRNAFKHPARKDLLAAIKNQTPRDKREELNQLFCLLDQTIKEPSPKLCTFSNIQGHKKLKNKDPIFRRNPFSAPCDYRFTRNDAANHLLPLLYLIAMGLSL